MSHLHVQIFCDSAVLQDMCIQCYIYKSHNDTFAFMFWPNVGSKMALCSCFVFTILTWILYTFMDYLFMLCKTALLCSLIITQCAWIFLVLMSRLDVQSCPAWVFSATLVTWILYTFVDCVFMFCKITLLSSMIIITQCAGIFLIFMSRLDVSVHSCIAGVFSATLITWILYTFVDCLCFLRSPLWVAW